MFSRGILRVLKESDLHQTRHQQLHSPFCGFLIAVSDPRLLGNLKIENTRVIKDLSTHKECLQTFLARKSSRLQVSSSVVCILVVCL